MKKERKKRKRKRKEKKKTRLRLNFENQSTPLQLREGLYKQLEGSLSLTMIWYLVFSALFDRLHQQLKVLL